MVKPNNLDEFMEILKNAEKEGKVVVVVDFTAKWCGPCQTIGPKFDKMASEFRTVAFVKVDVDEAPDVAEKYEVSAMPTFMIFKNSKKVDELVGASEGKLHAMLKKWASGSPTDQSKT